MAATSTLHFASADQSEELARADLYGLLARLWLAPPDAALLEQLRGAATQAPQAGSHLEVPWGALVEAFRSTTLEAAAAEHEALFHGIGKPDVFLYGSYYLTGFLNEVPLATLRSELQQLGLTRDTTRGETEDHVAYLFEVMRYLIAGDDVSVCNLEQQRRFFRAQIQTWVEKLCDAVDAQPRAHTWRAVSGLTREFVRIETQAFDMIDS